MAPVGLVEQDVQIEHLVIVQIVVSRFALWNAHFSIKIVQTCEGQLEVLLLVQVDLKVYRRSAGPIVIVVAWINLV